MNRKILILFLIVCTMTKLSAQSLQYDIAHYPFSMRGSYLTIFQLGEHTNFNTPGMWIPNFNPLEWI
jgi:disulfide bond formation protein DsbB